MTSRRYKWQTRWVIDTASRIATHADGLQVNTATWQALNGDAYVQAMTPKNGGHNATLMLRRLMWEARELYGMPAP